MTRASKPTIYDAVKARLGREPTNAEINAEVRRILERTGRRMFP